MRAFHLKGDVSGWLRLWSCSGRVLSVRSVHIRRVPEKTDRGIREDIKRKSNPKSVNDFVETGLSVALVGKPNVGKSTIYNRLVDSAAVRGHKSIVHPEPGVTRDVIYGEAVLHDLRFLVFDTAGLEESILDTKARTRITSFFDIKAVSGLMAMDDSEIYRALYRDMALKTALAVEKADAVLHIVDAQEGMSEVDRDIARWLLSIHKPDRLVLVANKYDSKIAEYNFHDFYELGLGEPVPLAAAQGLGLADLYTRVSGAFEYRLKEKAELQHIEDSIGAAQTVEQEANAPGQGSENDVGLVQGNPQELAADDKKERLEVERRRKTLGKDEKLTQFVEEKELDADLPNLVHASEKWQKAMDDTERDILVSIVGRPNVGKSTLVNKLIGKDVCLTGPAAGVTRDSVWIDHLWKGKPVKLVDTAGLRRKGQVESAVEMKSIRNTVNSIKKSHVCIHIMDAQEYWTQQDVKIANLVLQEGKCLLVALNKWDLIEEAQRKAVLENFQKTTQGLFPAVRNLKVVPISALKMQRQFELLDSAVSLDEAIAWPCSLLEPALTENLSLLSSQCEMFDRWSGWLKTSDLNHWLREFKKMVPIPKRKGSRDVKRFNLVFVAQTNSRPPTFTFRGASSAQVPDVYIRTLENGIRREFDWAGVPIRLKFLPREGTDFFTKPGHLRRRPRGDLEVQGRSELR